MTRTNNALSQLIDNPAWSGANYADANLNLFDPGTYKKFNPAKWKAAFPNYSQTAFNAPDTIGTGPTTQTTTSDAGADQNTPSSEAVSDDIYTNAKKLLQLEQEMLPARLDYAKQFRQQESDLSFEQMMRSYPILSQAAYEATQRNLAASKNFLFAKEATPTAQQARMQSAAFSEGERARALASQLLAAKSSWGQFGGKSIQVG